MTTFGHKHDHMDALKRYKDYKKFWERHRIPGEHKDKKLLWIDPGYQTFKEKQRSSAKKKNAQKSIKASKKCSVSESISTKLDNSTPTVDNSTTVRQATPDKSIFKGQNRAPQKAKTRNDKSPKPKQNNRKDSSSSRSSADSGLHAV